MRNKQDFMITNGNISMMRELRRLSIIEKFEYIELFTTVMKEQSERKK